MENNIQVTIGFPVYNVEKYVEKSLRSALDQDFTLPYEILVIDDRGTDQSMEIVLNLCKNHPRGNIIRVIRHNTNKGLGEARNTIIDNAYGKYLFFLDSDDWIYKNCLSKHYDIAEKTEADFTVASVNRCDEATGNIHIYTKYNDNKAWYHDSVGVFMLSQGVDLSTTSWNKLYRMDFLRKYNIRTKHKIYEDALFTYMIWLYSKRAACISDITICYNNRTGSIFNSTDYIEKKINILCEIIDDLQNLINKKFKDVKGSYDLYYKAISINIMLLICFHYTPAQKAYVKNLLHHVARKVPNVFYLHNNKNRFVYLCSLIYDNGFTFYHYEKWYDKITRLLYKDRTWIE